MRCATAAQFKKRKLRGAPVQDVPRAGTRLRELFDFFQAHKGIPVECDFSKNDGCAFVTLTDFYGLDIRRVGKKGWRKCGRKPRYLLAGEWFGRIYVDYVAEHLASVRRDSARDETPATAAMPPVPAVAGAEIQGAA